VADPKIEPLDGLPNKLLPVVVLEPKRLVPPKTFEVWPNLKPLPNKLVPGVVRGGPPKSPVGLVLPNKPPPGAPFPNRLVEAGFLSSSVYFDGLVLSLDSLVGLLDTSPEDNYSFPFPSPAVVAPTTWWRLIFTILFIRIINISLLLSLRYLFGTISLLLLIITIFCLLL
jgi:hypothetical protein